MSTYRIAVIGGTGPQGRGLGYRFARHGHTVVLGSRAAEKAVPVAEEVAARLAGVEGAGEVTGAANADACAAADVVLLAVPYDGHDELVATLPLAGKVVVSCVNPLAFDKQGPHGRIIDDGAGSAAESAQRIAPDATVVGAFHHVSAVTLWGDREVIDDEDVLVCGDSADAKAVAIELARSVTGRDGIDAGALRLARQLEPLTAVLISINKRYKVHSGIRISGLSGHA
ncbi:NADPH-dependent F420 reductase [Nocardioides sp. cx-173]|uniref:NADPH-dependent F420 reductase n=1 Tax=Nocardioides sp. cx-173 TaxID=2898796 RepID=UPI001E32CD6E|nr:NADPH-dependent F420 reductase [Nocardioides sp. cx-173]MCD4524609.1 NADPH-dependent F420 reductase [Nocardioides sp. cx-173]UGB42909.1 NADPH-dependent F420 reductase [Nocardioides sp. cx-173]